MGTKSKNNKTDEEKAQSRAHFVWQEQVAARTDLSPTYKVVLWRLALHRNPKTGRCNPAISTLAEGAGVSESTAQRTIAKAKQLGIITVGQGGKKGSWYDRNRYNFILPGVSPVTPPAATADDLGVSGVTPGGVTADTLILMNDQGTPSASPWEREGAAAPAASGAPALTGPPPRRGREKGRRKVGGTAAGIGTNGAAVPRPQELATLHGLWDRGHPADATVRQQQADAAAWTAALVGGATPETILVAAQKWIAAADAPRFLPKLSDWLTTHSWGKPPPKRGKQHHRANGAGRRRRSNGVNGSSAIFADVLGGGRARQ